MPDDRHPDLGPEDPLPISGPFYVDVPNNGIVGCSYPVPVFGPVTTSAFVATEPFPDMSVKLQSHGQGAVKAVRIENKTQGVWLKVLYGSENGRFAAGMKVFVHGRQYTQKWATDIQEFEGKKFILIPEKEVMVIDRRVS